MTGLETKLNAILNDKLTNLTPENLKKGVTCLGVEGTLEPSTSSGAKLFSTVEEMNSSTGNTEGDLAVVYKSETKNVSNGDTITSITFPKTVVFDEAISTSYDGRLRNDNEPEIYLAIQLDASNCMLYDMTGTIPEIVYTSSDGITYTRTDSNEDTYEIGEITVEDLDEHICKFIQVSGKAFEGLYEYQGNLNKNYIKFADLTKMTFNIENNAITSWNWDGSYITGYYSLEKINQLVKQYATDEGYSEYTLNNIGLYINSDKKVFFIAYIKDINTYYSAYMAGDTDGNVIGLCIHSTTTPVMVTLDLDNMTYQKTTLTLDSTKFYKTTYRTYYFIDMQSIAYPLRFYPSIPDSGHIGDTIDTYYSTWNGVSGTENSTVSPFSITDIYRKDFGYVLAPTQLTTTANDVYLTAFYGKNGVETGTLGQNVSNSFADVNAEIYTMIQQIYDNMEPRVLTDSDKTIDTNIQVIPTNSKGEVLLNTSGVTNMDDMFERCTELKVVPLLDTSNVTSTKWMFSNCTNLTEISQLNTAKVTKMNSMFSYCTNLKTIPLLDTSNVANMYGMFSNCTKLETIPALNTKKVTTMQLMFGVCSSLTTIPLLDTSNVTDMHQMFTNCTELTAVPALDTSNVTDMLSLFSGCTKLETVPALNASKATSMDNMFIGCSSLSDDSLNNILSMCISATALASKNKTLKYISLTETQAQKCTTLSNWQAFINAGWQAGYASIPIEGGEEE